MGAIGSTFSFGAKIFGGYMSFTFFAVFFIISIISITSSVIQNHDFGVAVKDLGSQFLNSTSKVNTISLDSKTNSNIVTKTGVFKDIWNVLKYYGILYFALYSIYAFIFVLGFPVKLYNASETALHWFVGIIFFFAFQVMYILLTKSGSINTPFVMFYNLFMAAPNFLTPITTFFSFYF
jgi:hypothetical protein